MKLKWFYMLMVRTVKQAEQRKSLRKVNQWFYKMCRSVSSFYLRPKAINRKIHKLELFYRYFLEIYGTPNHSLWHVPSLRKQVIFWPIWQILEILWHVLEYTKKYFFANFSHIKLLPAACHKSRIFLGEYYLIFLIFFNIFWYYLLPVTTLRTQTEPSATG